MRRALRTARRAGGRRGCARALARDARCAMPPDTSRGRWSAAWSRPTRCSSSRTRSRPARRAVPRGRPSSTFWAIVRHGSSRGSWNATAVRSSTSATSVSSRRMLPRVGASRPPTRRSRVDFPHPEGPTTATISPAEMSRSTVRSTSRRPLASGNDRSIPSSRTACAVPHAVGTAVVRGAGSKAVMCPCWPSGSIATNTGVMLRHARESSTRTCETGRHTRPKAR